MGQPLSGPLLVPVAEEKNCLEKLGQAIKCSGPEDTRITSVHSSLAGSGDIASRGGGEGSRSSVLPCSQKEEGQNIGGKHNDYHSFYL